jgi:hypothetical protein
MKKKTPENHRVSTSELLRRLSPEGFLKVKHEFEVMIRREKMKAGVVDGGKSKKGMEVRHGN